MRKILKFLLVVVVLIAAAYVAGFWPQRERISALQAENVTLQQRAEAAEARVRAGALLGEMLTLREVAQDMNYGQARTLASPFFEHVRAEAGRTADAGVKQALEAILAVRDTVTVALTQGDAAALGHLRESERRLRLALGYPPPPAAAPPAPSPVGASPAPAPIASPS
jgi:Tfp pilus assembly protein PilX